MHFPPKCGTTWNKSGDLWIAINGAVYDLSKFAKLHPGGQAYLLNHAGQDATKQFFQLHKKEVLVKYKKLRVGKLEGGVEEVDPTDPLVSEVPYAEMPLMRDGYAQSPYMNESHPKFWESCRKFIREEVVSEAAEAELGDEYPTKEMFEKLGSFGLFACRIGVAAMPVGDVRKRVFRRTKQDEWCSVTSVRTRELSVLLFST